ncbi:hypothetical protein RQN30_03450 [Arcanobacterium hippocoleae]
MKVEECGIALLLSSTFLSGLSFGYSSPLRLPNLFRRCTFVLPLNEISSAQINCKPKRSTIFLKSTADFHQILQNFYTVQFMLGKFRKSDDSRPHYSITSENTFSGNNQQPAVNSQH